MATHSSLLTWEIPWTGEPGGLQSTGLQRVRHSWAWTSSHPWCVSANPSPPAHPCLPQGPYICFLCLHFCFANKVFYIIFLDPTYMH